MRGLRVSYYWVGIMFLLFAAFVLVSPSSQSIAQSSEENSAGKADMVVIDTMKEYVKDEMPPVVFYHDKHTTALEDVEQPCLSCHVADEETREIDFAYMNIEAEVDPAGMKDAFHEGCLSCHAEYTAKGEDSGPAAGECRTCHSEQAVAEVERTMDMDKVLHYRHIEAKEIPEVEVPGQEAENCGVCHHRYDKDLDKLVPENQEEGNCAYCHEEKAYILEGAEDVEVAGLKDASHLSCVNCHRTLKIQKAENTGPLDCASCHGMVEKKQIQANNEKFLQELGGKLPRLERGQPDAALVTAMEPKDYLALSEDDRPRTYPPVAFNHLAHEEAVESCSSCHHESMQTCNTCHTIEGKEEGGFVQIGDAMHDPESSLSCIGCHNQEKRDSLCAGCHSMMPSPAAASEESCIQCHDENASMGMNLMVLSKEQQNEAARNMLEVRVMKPGLYPEDELPDVIQIDAIKSDEYKPAEYPHKRILNYLAQKTGESGLGAYFHNEEGVLCQSCHHYSPPSKNPPSCASCHGKPFDENTPNRPGLMAAYHGQCMSCHTAMGIEGQEITKGEPVPANTDCTGCHAEKN